MINILCSTDDNYVPYCGIMLTSLLENNKEEQFDVFIMTEGLSSGSQIVLNKLVDIYDIRIKYIYVSPNNLNGCPIRDGDHVSLATYYRLLAQKLLPVDIKKIIYFDCDIIVNGSVKDLWNFDISNFAVGSVIDESLNYTDKFERLGYNSSKGYLNAGMLLINLDYWRVNNVMERCFDCIKKNPDKLLFHDQDTLNIVLQDEKKLLPITYNFQTGFLYSRTILSNQLKEEVDNTIGNPIVIHYTGPSKPWHELSQHPYKSYYEYYKKISLWKRIPEIKRSFSDRLLYCRNLILWGLRIKKRPKTYIINKQKK